MKLARVVLFVLLIGTVFAATSSAADYVVTTQAGQPIIPGTTDTGNHCDDCTTSVTFPFPVTPYGQSYMSANVSSNGNIQFGSDSIQYSNACLPTTEFGATVLPYWDDLTTQATGFGVYSATTGSPPNRQFLLEWRAQYFGGTGNANFEAIFGESSGVIRTRYGVDLNRGAAATIGLQRGSTRADQFSCDAASLGNPSFQVTFTPIAPPPPPPPPPPMPPPPPPLPPPPPPPLPPPPPPPPLPPPPPPPPPPPTVRCRVPRVIGLRLAVARARIRRRKCAVGRLRRIRSKRVGRVVRQSPFPGAIRPRSTRVNLVIGRR